MSLLRCLKRNGRRLIHDRVRIRTRHGEARRFYLVTEPRPHVDAAKLLNETKYRGMGLGDLLSRDLEDVLENAGPLSGRNRLISLGSFILMGMRHNSSQPDLGERVLYYQTGDTAHLNKISEAVYASSAEVGEMVTVGPQHQQQLNYWEVFGLFGLADLLKLASLSVGNIPKVSRAIRASNSQTGVFRATLALIATLLRQLLSGVSAQRFLVGQSKLGLVAADYDRGYESASLCAAARAVGIPTCSFQHGVIVPSPIASGYSPLVADMIAVWGEAARTQLISENVPPSRISVVGNPIRYSESANRGARIKHSVNSTGFEIVLALSTPDESQDRLLVAHFAALRDSWSEPGYCFEVKLHPARSPEDYSWIPGEFGIPLLSRHQPVEELMSRMAAVLVTNSTFGIEAASRGQNVGIVSPPGVSIGFGQAFVEHLNMPFVDSVGVLEKLVAGQFPIDAVALQQITGDAEEGRIGKFITDHILPPRRTDRGTLSAPLTRSTHTGG